MTAETVLVTDGHLRASLAVVRSLGRAGHTVLVCSPRARSIAGSSRYAANSFRVPDALSRPEEFGDAVERLVGQQGVTVLLPMAEESLTVLLDRVGRLRGVTVPFPDLRTFRRVCDKEEVLSAAEQLGLATPEQVALRDPGAPVPLDALTFPIVVKPFRSVSGEAGRRTKLGVSYARSPEELTETIGRLPPEAFPLLLQRKIEGPGKGVFLLSWDGEVLAQFAHRRLREKPPSGGVSVFAESIVADPLLVEQSAALLAHFGWRGPAMVEFKEDERTGRHYVMEINGRFWGSLQLAIDAGVDFPRLAVAAARGHRPAPVLDYRTGVRWRWWWGEVDHLLALARGHGDPGHSRGLGTAVKHFLFPGGRPKDDILRWHDPMPFAVETLDWLRGR